MLIGNLTRRPDVKYTDSGMAVARFSVAISRGRDKGTDYPTVVSFGKTAVNIEKYLDKGSQVAIEGRIQTGSYEKNGQRVYTTDVIADRVEFLGKGTKVDERASQSVSEASEGFEPLDSEDLPF